jgi:hypothetical protein
MDRLDEDDAEAFGAWFDNETRDITDADSMEEEFREVYRGKWDSLADYAEDMAEQCGSVPKGLPDFIKFNNPEFQRIKEWFAAQSITETKGSIKDVTARVGGLDFVFGTGGMHASVENEY